MVLQLARKELALDSDRSSTDQSLQAPGPDPSLCTLHAVLDTIVRRLDVSLKQVAEAYTLTERRDEFAVRLGLRAGGRCWL